MKRNRLAGATSGDHTHLSHGKLAVPPLPLPWPDGSGGGWLVASALAHAPIHEWLWFKVNGKVHVAAVTMGWKASRVAEKQLSPVVRSITSNPASS